MLNSIILIGRLTKDPELFKSSSGISIASFSMAVNDDYVGKNVEKSTLFLTCKAFGKTGENICKFEKKGSLVCVKGRLSQYLYTSKKDNTQKKEFEALCDSVEFLDAKTGDKEKPKEEHPKGKTLEEASSIGIEDDDLPF